MCIELNNRFNETKCFDAITKIENITTYVNLNKKEYLGIDEKQGIYVFWFDNSDGIIKKLNRKLEIKGPNHKMIEIEWDWNLDNKNICLYVGKSTNIKKRFGQHLLLGTKDLYKNRKNRKKLYKRTTACQLRSGFDYLYLKENINIIEELNNRIKISIFEESSVRNRFYLEDLLIGKYKPWFNLDSER